MKAILINAKENRVQEVNYSGKLEEMYKLIGCRCICTALNMGDGNFMFVDDEGYLNGTKDFFKFKDMDMQWLAGNGLIIREVGEDTVDATVNAKKLEPLLVFMHCDDEESTPPIPPIRTIAL